MTKRNEIMLKFRILGAKNGGIVNEERETKKKTIWRVGEKMEILGEGR